MMGAACVQSCSVLAGSSTGGQSYCTGRDRTSCPNWMFLQCLEGPGEASRSVRKTVTAFWSPACVSPACFFLCSQISPRPLALASPVTPQMRISPASSSCPLFFSKVSLKYLSLLLDSQGGTGASSLSRWTKSNSIF